MITMDEVFRLSHLLDKEYAEEIKPLLQKSQEAIKKVIDVLYTDEYMNARKRTNVSNFAFGNLPIDIQGVMKSLRFGEDCNNGYQIKYYSIPKNLIDWHGYSLVAYDSKNGLMDIFCRAEHYRGDIVAQVNEIQSLKTTFNNIKNAFKIMFVDDDGAMFRRLTDVVSSVYNRVMSKDKEYDDKLYALFDSKSDYSNLKITVKIDKEN